MDSTNVIVGSGKMYVAPIGTTLPILDGSEYPVVWPAGWREVGFTDDGVEYQYNPGFKDIMVDEKMSPVKKKLISEKGVFVAKLAEATLENLNTAIAGSTLTVSSINAHDTIILEMGSSEEDNEVMVGFEGPAPGDGLTRVAIGYRAKNTATVGMKYQRNDKVVIPLNLELMSADGFAAGKDLCTWVDVLPDLAS